MKFENLNNRQLNGLVHKLSQIITAEVVSDGSVPSVDDILEGIYSKGKSDVYINIALTNSGITLSEEIEVYQVIDLLTDAARRSQQMALNGQFIMIFTLKDINYQCYLSQNPKTNVFCPTNDLSEAYLFEDPDEAQSVIEDLGLQTLLDQLFTKYNPIAEMTDHITGQLSVALEVLKVSPQDIDPQYNGINYLTSVYVI